jgi:hypothetical protein
MYPVRTLPPMPMAAARALQQLVCLAACLAALASAPGVLPPGWHRRQLATGQTYYTSDYDPPGQIQWELPSGSASSTATAPDPGGSSEGVGAPESSDAAVDRVAADSGHRKLAAGERAVAIFADGGRQLVRVARAHDEGYAGGVSYTVTTAAGQHRRLQQSEVEEAGVRFESPADGAVLVAALGDDPAVDVSATLESSHLELGEGYYQLCVELFGAPLLREPDGTPRVDALSYTEAGTLESLSVGCFDELQPLDLSDLPPGHFRLLASIHGKDDLHSPNATVDLSVLREEDTRVVASYSWRPMEPWQTAGDRLELNGSSSPAGPRLVRIPPRWELHRPLAPSAFGTLAMEVGASTTVGTIRAEAVKQVEAIASQSPRQRCSPGHVHRIDLSLDGTVLPTERDTDETVASLNLWTRHASLNVEVSSCEESPELKQIKDFVKRRSLDAIDVHEHPAHSLPPDPDPGFPLSTEAHAKLRLDASLAKWASRERGKKLGK